MKSIKNVLLTYAMITGVFFITSCNDDEDSVVDPINSGTNVEVRNTFQSELFSTFPGFEIFVNEAPFGDTVSSIVGSALEFEKFLGLYDINIDNNTINFQLIDVAPDGFMFREIEKGTFDRYYIKFGSAQAFKAATTDDEFVSVTILSDSEIKVEIGEGYSFTGGHSFNITIE